LNPVEKEETIRAWIRYLRVFKDHPAMIVVHRQAVINRDFNGAFLSLAKEMVSQEE